MSQKLLIQTGCCAFAAFIIFAALGPAHAIPRSGLGFQFDHYVGYFVLTAFACAASQSVIRVSGSVICFALALEIMQSLTVDRHADFEAASFSVGGAMTAALIADYFIRGRVQKYSRIFVRN